MLTKSLDLTPQIVTYTELGRLYLMRGDIAKATEIYRRATKYVIRRMDGWMDGWMDGGTDGWTLVQTT